MRIHAAGHATQSGAGFFAHHGARIFVRQEHAKTIHSARRGRAYEVSKAGGYFNHRESSATGGITFAGNSGWSGRATACENTRSRAKAGALTLPTYNDWPNRS